jgi:hypothetical protein
MRDFHDQGGDQRGLAGPADFGLSHAGAAKRRIRVERIGGYPIAHAPLVVIEEIGCYDLEIVPRRVRERAPAITISHRPGTLVLELGRARVSAESRHACLH